MKIITLVTSPELDLIESTFSDAHLIEAVPIGTSEQADHLLERVAQAADLLVIDATEFRTQLVTLMQELSEVDEGPRVLILADRSDVSGEAVAFIAGTGARVGLRSPEQPLVDWWRDRGEDLLDPTAAADGLHVAMRSFQAQLATYVRNRIRVRGATTATPSEIARAVIDRSIRYYGEEPLRALAAGPDQFLPMLAEQQITIDRTLSELIHRGPADQGPGILGFGLQRHDDLPIVVPDFTTEVRNAEEEPATGEGDPAGLHWIAEFDEPDLKAPSCVLVEGESYRFRTGLSSTPVPGAEVDVDVRDLLSQVAHVAYEIDVAGAVTIVAGTSTLRIVRSDAFPAEPSDPDTWFSVDIRAGAPGLARLDVGLVVRNNLAEQRRIEIEVVSRRDAPPAPTGRTDRPPLTAPDLDDVPHVDARVELTHPGLGTDSTIRASFLDVDETVIEAPTWEPASDLLGKTSQLYVELEKFSLSYRHGPAHDAFAMRKPGALAAMQAFGAQLHEHIFGPAERIDDSPDWQRRTALARRLADLGLDGSLPHVMIGRSGIPLPWGILYDAAWRTPSADAAESPMVDGVAIDGFWGARFQLTRASHARTDLRGASSISAPPVALGSFLNTKLKVANRQIGTHQASALAALHQVHAIAHHPPGVTSSKGLKAWASGPEVEPHDILYFFCHARWKETIDEWGAWHTQASDDASFLDLDTKDGTSGVELSKLSMLAKRSHLYGRPLVIMNACGTGRSPLFAESGFVKLALRDLDARGFVGTEWSTPTAFAHAYAPRLLTALTVERLSIGEALVRSTNDALAQGNPFGLIYALFSRPDLKVSSP